MAKKDKSKSWLKIGIENYVGLAILIIVIFIGINSLRQEPNEIPKYWEAVFASLATLITSLSNLLEEDLVPVVVILVMFILVIIQSYRLHNVKRQCERLREENTRIKTGKRR